MQKAIDKLIDTYTPITLQEMDGVSLLKRTDTKYILHKAQLILLLEQIKNDYRVLEIGETRISTYESLYYDTSHKIFYNSHHNGKIRRLKIRKRLYKESNMSFLEVKKKNGKGQTDKVRTQIHDFEGNLSTESLSFLEGQIPMELEISPSLKNSFKRITLVNKYDKERVTLDFNLKFKIDERKKSYKKLAIVEVKQEKLNRKSPIVQVLKAFGTNPERISKYCLGMISLYKGLKYNMFKEKTLRIKKITT